MLGRRARLSVNQDAAAGFLFVAFGAAGLWFGRDYYVGSALRMGPGYFPHLLSWLLVALGLGIGVKGVIVGGAGIERGALRPIVFILLAFIVFGVLLERAGLVLASAACVLTGAFGGSEFRWREQLVLSISLAIAAAMLFVVALGLSMPLFPVWD